MKKIMSDKNASFDIIMSREEESDCKNVKWIQDVYGKPLERDKKTTV